MIEEAQRRLLTFAALELAEGPGSCPRLAEGSGGAPTGSGSQTEFLRSRQNKPQSLFLSYGF